MLKTKKLCFAWEQSQYLNYIVVYRDIRTII
ncbi:hypothetical protein ABID22_003767 [Pontibacter aydingkolensis]